MHLPTPILTLPLLVALPITTAAAAAASTPAYLTLENFTRTSNEDTTISLLSFAITLEGMPLVQSCSYHVSGSPSTQASYENVLCGDYVIGSGWSDQFGPGNGFTTLSVKKEGLIAWPAYEDEVLKNGSVVLPDRSFEVRELSQVF